jgi:uncharacterized protein with GYD domain
MPKYAAFFKVKGETIAAMMDRPSDRGAAVRRLADAAGGKVESYYWMFGQYDGFAIFEAPDSKTVAAVVLAISSTGAFSVETHELVDPADLGDVLARAKDLRSHYQAPGR